MIQEFLNYAQSNKGLAARTVSEYKKDLAVFVGWAKPQALRWSTISKQHIEAYVAAEARRGMQPETIKKRITAVRQLYQYAIHQGLTSENPAKYVETPKRRASLPQTATLSEIDCWLNQQPKNGEERAAQAIAALIVETGLRLSEVTNLRRADFTGEHRIRVRGKGGKERIVIYGERTKRHFLTWVQRTHQMPCDLGERFIRRIIWQYGGRYVEGLHPHMLRHTFATEMLNHGVDLKTLAVLMGHESTNTTEIYTHLSTATLERAYNKFNS